MSYHEIVSSKADAIKKFDIKPNAFYFFGEGTPSQRVFVVSINNKVVTYKKYPHFHTKEIKCEMPIFKHLVLDGTRKRLMNQQGYLKLGDPYKMKDAVSEEIKMLESFMEGGEMPPARLLDYKYFVVHVKRSPESPLDDRTFWTHCEQYGNVCQVNETTIITEVYQKKLATVCADSNFEIMHIAEDLRHNEG